MEIQRLGFIIYISYLCTRKFSHMTLYYYLRKIHERVNKKLLHMLKLKSQCEVKKLKGIKIDKGKITTI